MYDAHVPVISNGMRSDPDIFARGVLFAVLSMRQPFDTVPRMLADVLDPDGPGIMSPYLFGFKRDAWRYTLAHASQLLSDVLAAPDTARRIRILCAIPGMGIVKAGFVLQLMGYDIGCLDTRNVKRAGLNPRAYRTDGYKGKATRAFGAKIDRYVAEVGGRAQELWDIWCEDVAVSYEMTPHEVSALHLHVVPDNFLPF